MTSFDVFKDLFIWLLTCVPIGLIFRYLFWY